MCKPARSPSDVGTVNHVSKVQARSHGQATRTVSGLLGSTSQLTMYVYEDTHGKEGHDQRASQHAATATSEQ